VGVKGIAIDETGRILLSLEKDGRWSMLGGGLHHNEDPVQGLIREVYEETGLDVTYVSKSPLYFLTVPKSDTGLFAANIIYEIRLGSIDFTPSDECQQLRFFAVDEMHALSLVPSAERLLKILQGLS